MVKVYEAQNFNSLTPLTFSFGINFQMLIIHTHLVFLLLLFVRYSGLDIVLTCYMLITPFSDFMNSLICSICPK